MRKQLKAGSATGALGRIFEALGQELIDAPDDEISAVARELGMNLEMRESAAFAGLTYPARPQLSDFFELEAFRQMRLVDGGADTPAPQKVRRLNPARRARKRRPS